MEILDRLSGKGSSKREPRSSEDAANFISYTFLSYLNPLFAKGNQQTIELPDLGPTSLQDRTDLLYERFAQHWKYEESLPMKYRSLWRPMWKTVGYWRLFLALLLYTIYTIESFGPILVLNYLVRYFQGSIDLTPAGLWVLVALMFFLPMSGSVVAAHSNIILAHLGLQFRNILVNKIYRKALLLSPAARQVSSTGQIVNMFSSDTQQIQRFTFFWNNIFMAVPTIAVSLYLIYQLLGVATFVGLGMIVITIPLNGVMFGMLNDYRKEKMLFTDYRVKLMNEILSGIRVLKFYAWEAAFKQKISSIRHKELIILKKMAYLIAVVFSLVLQAVPIFMPVLIFFTYVKLGNTLDAAKAFTAISLFNLMQFPFVFLPLGLSQYSQSIVSSQRLIQFFAADELKGYVTNEAPSDADKSVVISITNATMGWTSDKAMENMDMLKASVSVIAAASAKKGRQGAANANRKGAAAAEEADKGPAYEMVPTDIEAGKKSEGDDKNAPNRSVETLRNVNISIKQGELVAIVGSVGSGKSSLLSCILGELIPIDGSVFIQGDIAYCDQRPWILNDNVQNNILFGKEYVESKFDEAIYASCLEDDITILPGGLQTQIGEKGINLSGGQKARVALARAVYRDADIYLLDDPLSAVDAHVAQFIFHECICNALKSKTRLLVTHHVHILPHVDKVVLLEDGAVAFFGTYEELRQRGVDIEKIAKKAAAEEGQEGKKKKKGAKGVSDSDEDDENAASKPGDETKKTDNGEVVEPSDVTVTTAKSLKSDKGGDVNYAELRLKSVQAAKWRKEDSRATTLITKEEKGEGQVNSSVYMFYVRAGGIWLFMSFLGSIILNQAFTLLSSYWLQYWGNIAASKENDNETLSTRANMWYLNVYAALSSGALGFYIMRSVLLANHRLGTSSKLHDGLLTSTLAAPVAFFDTTPVGRILNRFSSDMQTVDEELSQTISQVSNSLAAVLGAIGAIAGATKGTFLVLMVPLVYFYFMIQKFFRATNTAIARIESISRSPIYADFSQALVGMTTIRAYREQGRFTSGLESAVNSNSIANITQQLSSQWLAIRLDFIGSCISFFIAVIAASTDGFIPAGFVALGLAYSFQLTTYLKFLVRMVATAEAQMNNVERIMYYMNHIDQEKTVYQDTSSSKRGETPSTAHIVPDTWPAEGIIEAEDLSMRYRDGPLVLKSVSFKTKGFEKVGIAGRTGSGKSSLMIALFRIQELSGGSIIIDGVDISSIPLYILRSRLGIIPQDPVMFSASVRFNIDPFETHSDAEVWDVLTRVNMKDHVMSLPKGLEEDVAEGGDNFSAGQRQLICIARAILRKPKILVLDEATASIDNENDAMIQVMVREQFKQCTVLTIAHRLNTIIDSDRVMVLDSGVVRELDSPQDLLAKPEGLFRQLWNKHLRSHGDAGGNASANAGASAVVAAVEERKDGQGEEEVK